jgi:hypothetical protein
MSDIAPLPIVPTASATVPMSAVAVARLPTELAGMAAGTILNGVVIGRAPGGQTVIRTQYGAVALKGAPLPTGSTVTLQLQQTGSQVQVVILSVNGGSQPPRSAAAPAPTGAPPTFASGAAPPSLGEAARMLTGHWDALAHALAVTPSLERFVPRPGPELAALALAIVAALNRGALADWIGRDAARGIPAPLATHLDDDFARMARLATPDPGAWRFVPIPLLCEGRLDQALLFLHGGHQRGGNAGEEAGMRILVEVDHRRLGRIQIDALVRPPRFDLIVRSHVELPVALRESLAAVHDDARTIAALTGTIGFHAAEKFVAPPLAADPLGVTA